MVTHRKTLPNGRSSGEPTSQAKRWLSPPRGKAWTWITAELISSPAWRSMSINAWKLISFLMREHMNHAGRRNGSLKATYTQLEDYGLTRQRIRPAIEEAEKLGLIRVGLRVRRVANRFTLTWIPVFNERTGEGSEATNDWRKVTNENVREILGKPKKTPPRKQNPSAQTSTELVREHAPGEHLAESPTPQESPESQYSRHRSPGAQTRTPSISGVDSDGGLDPEPSRGPLIAMGNEHVEFANRADPVPQPTRRVWGA